MDNCSNDPEQWNTYVETDLQCTLCGENVNNSWFNNLCKVVTSPAMCETCSSIVYPENQTRSDSGQERYQQRDCDDSGRDGMEDDACKCVRFASSGRQENPQCCCEAASSSRRPCDNDVIAQAMGQCDYGTKSGSSRMQESSKWEFGESSRGRQAAPECSDESNFSRKQPTADYGRNNVSSRRQESSKWDYDETSRRRSPSPQCGEENLSRKQQTASQSGYGGNSGRRQENAQCDFNASNEETCNCGLCAAPGHPCDCEKCQRKRNGAKLNSGKKQQAAVQCDLEGSSGSGKGAPQCGYDADNEGNCKCDCENCQNKSNGNKFGSSGRTSRYHSDMQLSQKSDNCSHRRSQSLSPDNGYGEFNPQLNSTQAAGRNQGCPPNMEMRLKQNSMQPQQCQMSSYQERTFNNSCPPVDNARCANDCSYQQKSLSLKGYGGNFSEADRMVANCDISYSRGNSPQLKKAPPNADMSDSDDSQRCERETALARSQPYHQVTRYEQPSTSRGYDNSGKSNNGSLNSSRTPSLLGTIRNLKTTELNETLFHPSGGCVIQSAHGSCHSDSTQMSADKQSLLVEDTYNPGLIVDSVNGVKDFNAVSFGMFFENEQDIPKELPIDTPMTLIEAFHKRIDSEREHMVDALNCRTNKQDLNTENINLYFSYKPKTDLNCALGCLFRAEALYRERMRSRPKAGGEQPYEISLQKAELPLVGGSPITVEVYTGTTQPAKRRQYAGKCECKAKTSKQGKGN